MISSIVRPLAYVQPRVKTPEFLRWLTYTQEIPIVFPGDYGFLVGIEVDHGDHFHTQFVLMGYGTWN